MGGTIQTENLLGLDDKPLDGWTLLSTTVASSDATIDVINLSSDYYMYKFIWFGVQPVTDNTIFGIQTSIDNGSSYDSGASDYASTYQRISMLTSPGHQAIGDNADTRIELYGSLGNAANELSDWEITLFNPSGTEFTKFKVEGSIMDLTATGFHIAGAGVRLSAAAVNAVRFLFSSGNISVGTLWVYGIKA